MRKNIRLPNIRLPNFLHISKLFKWNFYFLTSRWHFDDWEFDEIDTRWQKYPTKKSFATLKQVLQVFLIWLLEDGLICSFEATKILFFEHFCNSI